MCLSCTGTGERVCLSAEGFGNRQCFLESIVDKVSHNEGGGGGKQKFREILGFGGSFYHFLIIGKFRI